MIAHWAAWVMSFPSASTVFTLFHYHVFILFGKICKNSNPEFRIRCIVSATMVWWFRSQRRHVFVFLFVPSFYFLTTQVSTLWAVSFFVRHPGFFKKGMREEGGDGMRFLWKTGVSFSDSCVIWSSL